MEWFTQPLRIPDILHPVLERWAERARASPELAAAVGSLSVELRTELARVAACSEFAGSTLVQDPGALEWFGANSSAAAAGAQYAMYEERIEACGDAAQTQQLLREWRRRAMLRIAWLDIAGRMPVADTLRAVSDLADACIRTATRAAGRHLSASFGMPRDAAARCVPLIVLGMGKLGGRELNFSSDVDLIFLYPRAGQTDGAHCIDNEEYFNRLGRELIRLLDTRCENGFVFRVDMRLRPFGGSGPLAMSFAFLEDYLQQHGRDWERYAWIKARPIAVPLNYAAAYREIVRPFVYRRYLDFGVFESLRDMKALISREVSRRDLEQHLKLGKGGIREIEFIVQSLQLVRGGSDRRLQNPALLEVLPLLGGSKLLAAAGVAALRDAYLLLRKAENALQMRADQQIHTLPGDELARAQVSLAMGYEAWPAAAAAIEAARATVADYFDKLLFAAPGTAPADALFEGDETVLASQLDKRGLQPGDRSAVAQELTSYRETASYRRLDELGRRRVAVILESVLSAAATAPAPATLVRRVLRVLEAIGGRSSYLALLKEQPPALERLVQTCAISGFLSQQIAEFPLLLDELIDAKAFDELPSRAGFVEELAARTERLPADDPERQVESLRQFQKAAVFRVALADLTGRLPLMQVSDRLTDIAELIVQCCLDLAWQQMVASYGVPVCGDAEERLRPVTVAAAGYGKLGGLELGYGSDLDLVFLHDSAGSVQRTRGARSIDNGIFFVRLLQRIVHLLTMHSAAGRLYAVDMRLRPNGNGGFLMTGIESFERYQQEEAWTWEHQALLRARPVAGDPALCARFEAARRQVLSAGLHAGTLREDVLRMRLRMRRELSQARSGEFDIKQDAGGIADIEFFVQYRVLEAAPRQPQLLRHTDNVRQLQALAAAGDLPADTAQWLIDAYIGYRLVLHRSSLEGHGERVVEAAPHAATRAGVTRIWEATFG